MSNPYEANKPKYKMDPNLSLLLIAVFAIAAVCFLSGVEDGYKEMGEKQKQFDTYCHEHPLMFACKDIKN